RVVLAPGLERLDHVSLDARVLEKHPRFVDEKGLEDGRDPAIGDKRDSAIQDVEEQRFEKFGVVTHALEIETLESGEGDRVLGIVKEKSELAPLRPLSKAAGNIMAQRVRKDTEGSESRVHRIEIFNLKEKIAFGSRVEITAPLSLNQDLQEKGEEIQILLGRLQRKRIDFEIGGFQAHADIGAAEQLGEAFKAPTEVENEGVRLIFLKIRN